VVEGTVIRAAELKDGGLGGFNPYGNEQSLDRHFVVIEEQFTTSLMSLPWILLPCGCVFLRDSTGGAFLSRCPSCWKFNHLFFSIIDGVFFNRQRQRCLDDIPLRVFTAIGREDLCEKSGRRVIATKSNGCCDIVIEGDAPLAGMGVKDDGLGGFNPYGNEQCSWHGDRDMGRGVSVGGFQNIGQYAYLHYSFSSRLTRNELECLACLVRDQEWSPIIGSDIAALAGEDEIPEPLLSDLQRLNMMFMLSDLKGRHG